MSGTLTAEAVMMCPHGGTVQAIPSTTNVTIGGAPVLTAADTFLIAGCPFVVALVPFPCVTVQWVTPAMQHNFGGNPALTMSSVGLCLSAAQSPQGPVVIVSAQPQVTGL